MRLPITAALLAFAALPAQAQSDARPYRAFGTEPFWSLTIDGTTIRYQPAGAREIRVPRPEPIVGFNGELYETRTLAVSITHGECSDGMSDRLYSDTVRVIFAGRTLRGCGGEMRSPPIRPVSLLEGDWAIQSIGGRPPVAASRPWVRFESTRLSGSTGCNSFSGGFGFERGRLTAGPLATTRRGCTRWLGAQEQKLLGLLGQRLTVSRNPNGKLVMTARGGETLVLAPRRP